MADSSKLIMVVVGGGILYYAYTQGWLSSLGLGGMPSDAYYVGVGTALTSAQGTGCPNSYVYYSPSAKAYYCSATAPTAAQTTAGQTAATSSATTTSTTSSTSSTTTPVVGANTLDAIYAAIVAAANAANVPAAGLNVDGWGYYLNNQLASQGLTAPDPLPIFTAAIPGFARAQLMTAAQYWGIMAPALKSQLGLSGLGLYGGLGLLAQRYR